VAEIERVALLAGGTGGAKLAAGMQELVGEGLSVIANTADDIEILGVDVSPDPDLITYWLADEIDEERGWGIRGDSFTVFERLRALGAPDWFQLSDRDLATCMYRAAFVAEGGRRTDAQRQIAAALDIRAAVLPMCEQPVRTKVVTSRGRTGLQQFLIAERAEGPIEGVELEGIAEARPTPEVLEAISSADAIVVGPSNPVISIGPILAVGGIREAIRAAGVPVVAVSPYVAGKVLKGPTNEFMEAVGRPANAAGVASLYEGAIDAIVCDPGDPDPPPDDVAVLRAPTLMDGAAGRRSVASVTLEYAADLSNRV
jgi:LPPG:FO 2-phospho-L-lactate transferase